MHIIRNLKLKQLNRSQSFIVPVLLWCVSVLCEKGLLLIIFTQFFKIFFSFFQLRYVCLPARSSLTVTAYQLALSHIFQTSNLMSLWCHQVTVSLVRGVTWATVFNSCSFPVHFSFIVTAFKLAITPPRVASPQPWGLEIFWWHNHHQPHSGQWQVCIQTRVWESSQHFPLSPYSSTLCLLWKPLRFLGSIFSWDLKRPSFLPQEPLIQFCTAVIQYIPWSLVSVGVDSPPNRSTTDSQDCRELVQPALHSGLRCVQSREVFQLLSSCRRYRALCTKTVDLQRPSLWLELNTVSVATPNIHLLPL